MCQGRSKPCVGFVRVWNVHRIGNWKNGATLGDPWHFKGHGIWLNEAQIFEFLGSKSNTSIFFYNQKKMIDEFNRYVVLGEKPFMMGESKAFHHFIRGSLQSAYRSVSRGALKQRIKSYFTNIYIELLNTWLLLLKDVLVWHVICGDLHFRKTFLMQPAIDRWKMEDAKKNYWL